VLEEFVRWDFIIENFIANFYAPRTPVWDGSGLIDHTRPLLKTPTGTDSPFW
jgi:hypothetical protein